MNPESVPSVRALTRSAIPRSCQKMNPLRCAGLASQRAATGAVAVGTAAVTPGTLIAEIAGPQTLPLDFVIEHPSGKMPIHIELRTGESAPVVYIIRTARRLFEGKVFVETPDQ